MPTSTYSHIPTMIRFFQMIKPASILDIGVGNGKMGFLARDLLDVMIGGNYKKENWGVRIDGIEVFPEYIQAHQRAIYDDIYIGDSFEVMDRVGEYDLIILGDVLEHFTKEKAWQFLDKCVKHCRQYMIINIPLGEKWTQPPMFGNSHEEHLSFWTYEEFGPFTCEKEFYHFSNIGDYGCLLVKKENYMHYRLRDNADALYFKGNKQDAVSYLKNSLPDLPPDIDSEYLLVDLLLRDRFVEEAKERLDRIIKLFPDDGQAKEYLEKLISFEKNAMAG
ncbi:MAG: class I SAM-dependent methyltransferase [Nitrospirae bacterium]|nr:class I SAM-dependent methyltransferase [Nitrospirota bacterium]